MNKFIVTKKLYLNGEKRGIYDVNVYSTNNAPRVNLVLGTVDPKYISYYIREVEKVLRGEIDQTIISGSEELEDAEDMIVTKEWSKAGRPEEKLETSEVLEFLKIMKREYGVGDEIIEDPRLVEYYNIKKKEKENRFKWPWQS